MSAEVAGLVLGCAVGWWAGVAVYRLLHPPRLPQQTCWTYCPRCRAELTAVGDVLYDDARGVAYRCPECETLSLWDFDAPVPLLLAPRPGAAEVGG